MSTITISNADWEILEAVPSGAVTIDSVTGSLITVSVDLGDGRTAIFLISGAWTGVSGTSLAGLMGTVSGISMLIDGITQFDATGLAFDVTEVTEEILAEVSVLVELAMGDSAEIIGSDDDDSLSGTAGNDSVSGNLGDDDLFGDLGDDSLSGGDGFDSLDGGDGNDTLSGGVGDDSLTGGGGNDRLYAGSGTDTLIGGMGNDFYYVDSSADAIVEGSSGGTDTEVASFSDTLDDNIENLILTGSAALNGIGNAANNVMTGNTGANSLSGGLGNDKLNGGDGDDSLTGGDGADSLAGGNGNDRLYAGTGTDTLTGGAGNDYYYVDSSADVMVEGSSGGTDTEVASFSDTLDDNIENLILTGSAALNGIGNAASNVMTGNTGANSLSGGLGNDKLSGGDGDDSLTGGDGADSLAGGNGNDRLYAGTGTDTLTGGAGNDYYYVDSSADVMVEGSSGGTDTEVASFSDTLDDNIENLILTGSAALNGIGNAANNVMTGNTGANSLSGGLGNDKLNGGDGDDSLTGGDGADSLTGGNGNDRLYAGTGTDTLTGGAGNDYYYVDSSADVIVEGSAGGIDTEVASFSETLDAGIENLVLSGLAALYGTGNAANNVMTGNAGANTLSGGLGDDLLRGGAGNDILYGGGGRDIFRFDAILGSGSTPNLDQIKDFSVADDTIQLENSIFTAFGTSTTGTINAGCFKSNTMGLAADSNDYMIYETDTGKLFFDADGSGAGDAVQIGLLGVNLALTNADFVLV